MDSKLIDDYATFLYSQMKNMDLNISKEFTSEIAEFILPYNSSPFMSRTDLLKIISKCKILEGILWMDVNKGREGEMPENFKRYRQDGNQILKILLEMIDGDKTDV